MIRITAQFEDWRSAGKAIDALVAGSFPVEDIRLHAVRPDGTSPQVPIGVRSHLPRGFVIGGLAGALLGVVLSVLAGVEGPIGFGALGGGSVGCVAGGAIGLGSWSIRPARSRVPADVTTFVVAVLVPQGRADEADRILAGAGGVDAAPRLVG